MCTTYVTFILQQAVLFNVKHIYDNVGFLTFFTVIAGQVNNPEP